MCVSVCVLVNYYIRVAIYHPPKFHDFSDFSLTFCSFPSPLIDQKKNVFILYFDGANCITSNTGVTLKGKNLLPKGAYGLILSHEKVHLFPS